MVTLPEKKENDPLFPIIQRTKDYVSFIANGLEDVSLVFRGPIMTYAG